MKKLHLFACFCLFAIAASAQPGARTDVKKNMDKQLVYFGHSWGSARWFSELDKTSLFDRQGVAIETGSFGFRATSPFTSWDSGILFPFGKVRAGLGLSFEKFILSSIQLDNSSAPLIFDESFRFDVLYAQFEVPLFPEARSAVSASVNLRGGYFNFSGVQRINLFGNDNASSNWFLSLAPVADYAIWGNFFVYVQPHAGIKFFNSQAVDPEGSVKHTIVSYGLNVGLRFDPSQER
ncbi:MAG: hypothetical protein MUC87_04575 [Bacteroidia bacterium]|jgi:hypothetical protein|nr:hypothetical protein [Bacteroidia bacterium]